jgi:hypothetical protein
MPREELKEIVAASKGLTYPSESDEPFEAVRWGVASTVDPAVAKVAEGRAVVTQTVAEFFAELEASEEGKRWTALRQAVERLGDVRVLRVGERRVDVYVVGRSRRGEWVGLHTVSVET